MESKRREYEKRYVEVIARHCIDGRIDPLTIIWDDGRRFPIERVMDSRRTRCGRTTGFAIRYKVQVNRCTKFLYHDAAGWFVESPIR